MRRLKRVGLLVLAMAPIASVAFAAKSALSSAQIGKRGVSDRDLAKALADSTTSG